jgi:hypothetical protein
MHGMRVYALRKLRLLHVALFRIAMLHNDGILHLIVAYIVF